LKQLSGSEVKVRFTKIETVTSISDQQVYLLEETHRHTDTQIHRHIHADTQTHRYTDTYT